MSTIQNFIKRHYIKITSATALAVGLYKFAEYAVVDHSKGQSYPLAFMQNVYWLLQERLGILEQDKIPYKEEDISRETIQYCLRTGGIILPDGIIKRISFRRMGNHMKVSQVRTYCIDITYGSGTENGPVQLFLKLSPTGFLERLKARLSGWCISEGNVYTSEIFEQSSLRVANVFYCNYIPGRQVYCIMQEMLGHLPHGSINEILGMPMSNSIAAVRSLARMHSKYFNKVKEHGPEWIGSAYTTTRLETLRTTGLLNIDGFLSRLKTYERDGYLPTGSVTMEVMYFYRLVVTTYLAHVYTKQKPRENGGDHNTTIVHGDFRGTNMLLDGEHGVIFSDFKNVHENSPGVDLAFFLSSSIKREQDFGQTREILTAYYDELIHNGGVDAEDYPWHRLLAEVSMGFSYDALQHIIYLADLPHAPTYEYDARLTAQEENVREQLENATNHFANRFRRAIAQQRYWKSPQMIKLALGYGSKFPPVSVYSRYLPQDLLEDAFHPDSLSF
jgi:thiamine kinase-like enzyme|eukprot:g11163.t1